MICALLYFFHIPKIYGNFRSIYHAAMHYLLFSEEYKLRSQLNFEELLVSIHHFEKLFFVRSHHLTKQSWNKQKKVDLRWQQNDDSQCQLFYKSG